MFVCNCSHTALYFSVRWIRVFAYLVFLFASVFVLLCVFVFVFECNYSNIALHCCARWIRVQQEGAPPDSAHQGFRLHRVAFAYFLLHLTISTSCMDVVIQGWY